MKVSSFRPWVATLFAVAACGGPAARAPVTARGQLPRAFADAFQRDATGLPAEAVKAYLDVAKMAAPAEDDPWQVAAIEASLDALDARSMPSLGIGARDAGLAYRTLEGPAISDGLGHAFDDARGPFARGLFARGLARLAERRGD
ncbi:MAG TPA: hypothetical protein VHV30_15955, partial [Polyangiaceae bacterium]|nr:hypothetical protein [Polyangiaceae bacterium]